MSSQNVASIIFDNVSYLGNDATHKILQDVSFQVIPNQVTCLLGVSGSGKSTILRLISGLDLPQFGTIYLRNQIASKNGKSHLKAEKRDIALMFQDYALMPFMSVLDNVLFAVKNQKTLQKKAYLKKASEILSDVGLADHQHKYPMYLSGGEQQRLALARAIMQNTDIVMLDEPFSNLDSALRRRLCQETLSVLKKHHKTVLMVTHDPTEAFLSADHILYLRDGKIIQSGSPENIYLQPKNLDVALFSGAVNTLQGHINNQYCVETPIGNFITSKPIMGKVSVAIRYEGFVIKPQDTALMNAKILKKEFAGKFYRLTVLYNNYEIVVELNNYSVGFLKIGDYIALTPREDAIFVFSETT